MINIKQWNVKQIIIGFLICMMVSAVFIMTLTATAQVNDEPAGFAWEIRTEVQNGEIVSLRDMWLVDADGDMIPGSLATFENNCRISGNLSVRNGKMEFDGGESIYDGGRMVCHNASMDLRVYNKGAGEYEKRCDAISIHCDWEADQDDLFRLVEPIDWPGTDALWGIQVCHDKKKSTCDIPTDYLDEISVEAELRPSTTSLTGGSLVDFPNINKFRFTVAANHDSIGWLLARTPRGNDPLFTADYDWGNRFETMSMTTSCDSDADCQLEYSIGGESGILADDMPTQYRQYMSGPYYLGIGANGLDAFRGDVEYVTIRGLSCEDCSN